MPRKPNPSAPAKTPTRRRSSKAAEAAPLTAPAEAIPKPLTGWLSGDDYYWFHQGRHLRLYDKLGAHCTPGGVQFSVWAPNAEAVSVIGDFNQWQAGSHRLAPQGDSGIWAGLLPEVQAGAIYKYALQPRGSATILEKGDPFAQATEVPPRTGSVVAAPEPYSWSDQEWMEKRAQAHGPNSADAPISIYELHLGSFMRVPEEGNRSLTYRELAPRLIAHLQRSGFTHVEFLPVMEHPFFGSWGYQVTGYFAPSSRYGSAHDLMYLIDQLHRHGFGVLLDWVPSHFPNDAHGLAEFDGSHLYEHADPRQGFHPDWHSCIFNYGRHEVRSFLLSNAMFWLDRFHADGLRVDAVASMLYLDYSRQPGEWIPNQFGGRENLEAISLLRQLNEDVYGNFPGIQTVAEESTAWPMVSRPTYLGGLGFGMKWDMGWMHDTLAFFAHDPIHRKYHHSQLTFRQLYAWQENFVLPLSHDEVVHGKASLLAKMPGDEWQRFANLRLLYGLQYGQSGKKLLFMGDEFGQGNEWNHDSSIEWHLLQYPVHAGLLQWVRDLNTAYRNTPALHQLDFESRGFQWVDCNDTEQSTLSWLRWGSEGDCVLIVCNFTPVGRLDFQLGVPRAGHWREILNSDAVDYCGSGQGNLGGVWSDDGAITINLPPLGCVFFRHEP
ncbi:MAG TPA: 1,4-alpha-glucan branching protein GlgB [Terriglobales bacterium]|nr:1,4-alpha-glucan branching protein GlgB [Terriglobales bacterium]